MGLPEWARRDKYDMDDEQATKMGLTKAPPPLITALAEQFGLKLESGKVPVEVVVVDSVSRPSPNRPPNPPDEEEVITLVFRDAPTPQVRNYILTLSAIYLTGKHFNEIPVSDIGLEEMQKGALGCVCNISACYARGTSFAVAEGWRASLHSKAEHSCADVSPQP